MKVSRISFCLLCIYLSITDESAIGSFVLSSFSSSELSASALPRNNRFGLLVRSPYKPNISYQYVQRKQLHKSSFLCSSSRISLQAKRKDNDEKSHRKKKEEYSVALRVVDKHHSFNRTRRHRAASILKNFGLNQLVKRWKRLDHFDVENPLTVDGSSGFKISQNFTIDDKKQLLNDNSSAKTEKRSISVTDVQDLHKAILHDKNSLKDIIYKPSNNSLPFTTNLQLTHPVLSLIAKRIKERSTPSNRSPSDKAVLSLAIEGGGMRGAVSAGMASAIVSLGLMDAFDSVYGSSAGAIVGAYMISRQMCVDVYTEILVTAKETFVCKKRMLTSLIFSAASEALRRSSSTLASLGDSTIGHLSISWTKQLSQSLSSLWARSSDEFSTTLLLNNQSGDLLPTKLQLSPMPGMNLTFVVDGIMNNRGLRPLDWESFHRNDMKQPLRIVSSTVREGRMETVAFSSRDGDFYGFLPEESSNLSTKPSRSSRGGLFRRLRNKRRKTREVKVLPSKKAETYCVDRPQKRGLLACLEASMNVPGAAGPPLRLLRNMHQFSTVSSPSSSCPNITISFDAFCYEPIPYRSAVKDGSTHCLVLRSRPEGFQAGTQPTIYERLIAPLYFYANDLPEVARFFERGGQQYRYLEDLLVLEKGRDAGLSSTAVSVPPTDILYGLDDTRDDHNVNFDDWKKAYLFPLSLPRGATELSTVSTETEEVLKAVRDGFATAFDLLAPIIGLDLETLNMNGTRVAELVFPDQGIMQVNDNILAKPIQVKGEQISEINKSKRRRIVKWLSRRKTALKPMGHLIHLIGGRQSWLLGRASLSSGFTTRDRSMQEEVVTYMKQREADLLLSSLPGFQMGKFPHLSRHLRSPVDTHS